MAADDMNEAERLLAGNQAMEREVAVGEAAVGRLTPTYVTGSSKFSEAWFQRRAVRKAALTALPHTARDAEGIPYMPIPPLKAAFHICPRCKGDVPTKQDKGQYNGAISRTDNKTEICSACGDDESDEDKADKLTPQSRWPVTVLTEVMSHANPLAPTQPATLMLGTKGWTAGPPMRKPGSPDRMPDLRHNLMDGWALHWPSPFESASNVELLNGASLWWVSREMCELLYSTLHTIPKDTMVENLVIPEPMGLVYFATPRTGAIDAASGEPLNEGINAITWVNPAGVGPNATPCLSVASYTYIDFDNGFTENEMELLRGLKLLDMDGSFGKASRQRLADMGAPMKLKKINGKMENALTGGIWAPLGRSDWPHEFALDAPSAVSHLEDQDGPGNSPAAPLRVGTTSFDLAAQDDRRVISAFFSLIQSASLTRVADEKPSRQVIRQAQRKNKPIPPTVKVVYLRRPSRPRQPGDGESSGGHLSYRFPVRAHARNQACGPGMKEHRLIMIDSYVKGPKDAPFVPKETVHAWVR